MKVKGFNDRIALGVLVPIFALLDLRVALLFITQHRYVAYSLWVCVILIVAAIALRIISVGRFPIEFWAIMWFGVFSLFVNAVRGVDIGVLVQSLAPYVILPVGLVLLTDERVTTLTISKTLLLFSIAHLIVYVGGIWYFPEIIDKYTGYGESSVLVGRATGVWQAPAQLALYAIIATAYSMAMYKIYKRSIDLCVVTLGVIMGLITGNRSYVVALFIVIVMVSLWRPVLWNLARIPYGYVGFISRMSLVLVLLMLLMSQQISLILERLSMDQIVASAMVRIGGGSGLIPSIQSLMVNPFVGNAQFDGQYYGLRVYYQDRAYSASNGVVAILAYNGIFAGAVFIGIYIRAILKYMASIKSPLMSDTQAMRAALFFCIIGASVICLADALLQSSIMLMMLAFAFYQGRIEATSTTGVLMPKDTRIGLSVQPRGT